MQITNEELSELRSLFTDRAKASSPLARARTILRNLDTLSPPPIHEHRYWNPEFLKFIDKWKSSSGLQVPENMSADVASWLEERSARSASIAEYKFRLRSLLWLHDAFESSGEAASGEAQLVRDFLASEWKIRIDARVIGDYSLREFIVSQFVRKVCR